MGGHILQHGLLIFAIHKLSKIVRFPHAMRAKYPFFPQSDVATQGKFDRYYSAGYRLRSC